MTLNRTTTQLRALQPSVRQQVLWLHAKAFGDSESSPCKPCGGYCCKNCAGAHGYQSDENFERLKAIYLFDDNTEERYYPEAGRTYTFTIGKGFLTDKGCALPMEERSTVCLSFICGQPPDHVKERFTLEQHRAANGIFNLMSNPNHLSNCPSPDFCFEAGQCDSNSDLLAHV